MTLKVGRIPNETDRTPREMRHISMGAVGIPIGIILVLMVETRFIASGTTGLNPFLIRSLVWVIRCIGQFSIVFIPS